MKKLSVIGLGVGIGLLALAVLYTASAYMWGHYPMMGWLPDGDENQYPAYGIPELPEGPAVTFWMHGGYQQLYGYGFHCPMMGW